MKKVYDVAIVGYGPVAKLLAALLGKKGWKVGIIERFTEGYKLPRAVHYDHEITRILQSVVPFEEVRRISQTVPDSYEWQNAKREILLSIDWTQDGISGWPGDMFFNQPELEDVLDQVCKSTPTIELNLGYEAISAKVEDDKVFLTIKEFDNKLLKIVENGSAFEIESKYLIGCDGANSFVANYLDTTETSLDFEADWLVIDIIPNEEWKITPMNVQICDPERPTTVVSGGTGRRRWEFMLLPGETKEQMNRTEVAWKLLEKWNVTPQNAVLERHAVYTFKALWKDNWRKDNLLIAGDSAHLTPPFMGQGLCSGLRDAMNLSWKLDSVLKGVYDDSILETYTAERSPHNEQIVNAALYLGKMICETDLEKAKIRDEAFLTGNVPEFPTFPILENGILSKNEFSKLVGELSLQAEVEYNGKQGFFDDVVGHGWFILTKEEDLLDHLNEEQLDFLNLIEARILNISNKAVNQYTVGDLHSKYSEYFELSGVTTVIIRPDFYTFGACNNVEDAKILINELQEQLNQYITKKSLNKIN